MKLTTGETVTADDAYMRESILLPKAKIVLGYTPIMPSFQGQLTEEQTQQCDCLSFAHWARRKPKPKEEGKQ